MASANLKKRLIDLLSGSHASTGYYGFADLAINAELVADIYEEEYDAAGQLKMMTWFAERSISVIGEYPRGPEQLPAIVVQRVQDSEYARGPLGHAFGPDRSADTNTDISLVWGTRSQETFQISVWALESTAMRDVLYLALKELLFRGRAYLEAPKPIELLTFRGGRDTQQDVGTLKEPLIIHQAVLTIEAKTKTTWKESRAKATELKGSSEFTQWKDEA